MKAARPPGLQDQFLNAVRRSKAPVSLFLVKGVRLGGHLTWFDAFSLLLRREGTMQLVYKHGVSTVQPSGPLDFVPAGAGASDAAAGLQDRFLAAAQAGGEAITLFLLNGVMLQGRVAGFDPFVLLLERDGQWQMIYKHAISTLQPGSALDLGGGEGA